MPKIKLIASDIDGTMLLEGGTSLSPEIFDYIQRLRERGILFFAASGRPYGNLQRLFAPVKEQIGYLCENGCFSFYHDRLLHRERMDRELGQDIIRAVLQKDGAEVMVAGLMKEYIQPKDPDFYHYLNDVVDYDVEVVPDLLNIGEEYMKVSIYEKEGVGDGRYWRDLFGSRCAVVTSGRIWMDTMPHSVNKGSALARVLRELDISPQECLAIGDNENDREMLKLVGYPASVQSAKPAIRAIARLETDTVGHLFQKILSGGEEGL
ncbi:MAG: HAD family hydrolase [Fretibacterium sp.]|nr:HAD family hydrolase [Fretibacterium sp.]